MRYIALGLYAEGPTDHTFLQRVLYKSTLETAVRMSDKSVMLAESFVRPKRLSKFKDRADRVLDLFSEPLRQGAISLLFIHADGGTDHSAADSERIAPAITRLKVSLDDSSFGCVGVIPVRETEAWALADVDALREELGTRLSAEELQLPVRPADVERLLDPKQTLRNAQALASPSRRGRRTRFEAIPAGLGDRVNHHCLRQVPAFARFEAELEATLRSLWNLPENTP
jgi:Domain of unknown function (DUF4276)